MVTHIVEKEIEKPLYVKREREIAVPETYFVPHFSDEHIPIVVSSSFAKPVFREEGYYELPISHYVPRFVPVKIPAFVREKYQ